MLSSMQESGSCSRLQIARRDLSLVSALEKFDKYDLIVLDDISYVRKDQAETSVLFELIAHRYERHSIAITANQSFSAWNSVFTDAAMTAAAVQTRPTTNRTALVPAAGDQHIPGWSA